ncbi:MAG TPA: hypothetical protein VGS79_17545 [Puia sp.]|nr:hypothetical protein [Puia sp.]
MRITRLFFLTLTICTSVASQAQKGTTILEVDGGVSIPLGNWGNTSTASSLQSLNGTKSDVNGYANTGGFFSADGAWFFSKYFGIGGMFRYGTYNMKGIDSLSQGYEESFDVDTTRTYTTNYKVWSVMPGVYFNYPLVSKLSLTARALVGIADAKTPQIYVNIEDGGVTDPPAIQYSASKIAFAADLGVGFRYDVFRGIAVNLKADYFYTKPDFTINNTQRITNAGREVYTYDQPLESVNVAAGISYSFGHKHKSS